ncbi:MAG TPA: class I SAM-dependent methyltransferase [Terriglobales bacterium]|nr:class I SAM-dependent methyltransferase [Terriglobales bacterium]
MAVKDATRRFSSRVDNYVRYRPGYPREIVQLLENDCGLTPDSIIADIAFGTGIFTRLLLENGNHVFGVEPNTDMRKAGEEFLRGYPKFKSVEGTAEETTLVDRSVDFVTAAQAAHWFNLKEARREFQRILKPAGWAVLIWNERRTDSTDFLRDYEQLLVTYGTDYQDIRHERTTAAIDTFFSPSPFQQKTFELIQQFDYAGLEGRLLSSSYAPSLGEPNHELMLKKLRRIFKEHQKNGYVAFEYDTKVYYGQLK